jgi:3-oxoacyl-[acyl-carrier-protein] synthase II
MEQRVVITGVGLISVLGDSPLALYSALCEGRKGLHPLQQFASNGHGCHLGGQIRDFRPEAYLSGRPLRPLDRTCQLTASAARLALESSGWTAGVRATRELGLAVGTMFGGVHTIAEFDRSALLSGPGCASPMAFANTVINAAAGQTAIWHNLRGVNSTIAAGSISGLAAIGYASDLIRSGTADAMLAGGADEFCFESFFAFGQAGFLCRIADGEEFPIPFDKRRNGFALAEGAAFLMLESWDSATEHGSQALAEIKGHGNAFDCSRGRDSHLATRAIARAMNGALCRACVVPDSVDFVSTSANGSVLQDDYESRAIKLVFGSRAQQLPVTAIKCGTGEALGASGPLQVSVLVETLHKGTLPGITGLRELDPGFPLGGAAAENREMSARCALVNSVGLDGNACSMVITAVDS